GSVVPGPWSDTSGPVATPVGLSDASQAARATVMHRQSSRLERRTGATSPRVIRTVGFMQAPHVKDAADYAGVRLSTASRAGYAALRHQARGPESNTSSNPPQNMRLPSK